MKKRYKITTILAAALLAVAMTGAAVAGVSGHLAEMFRNPENNLSNDAIAGGIQSLNASYEGATVRCTMQEALYDAEGGTFALSWAMDNLTGEEELYVVCDRTLFDGEMGSWRNTVWVSDFFLPEGTTVSSLLGELPDANANHCELSFTILRAIGPYEQEDDGYIPLDEQYSDARYEGALYSDLLAEHANFEIADRFTLEFELDKEKLGSTAKRLVGENRFAFDGCELNVTFGEITATKAHIVVEYISDTEIVDGGKGIGPNYDIDFALPEGDIWWTGNSGGSLGDPEHVPDGRWRSVYDFEAVELYTQPDELLISLSLYPVKDGEMDLGSPIEIGSAILRFE